MQHGIDDVEADQQARLLVGNGDEWRLRIPGPQGDFGGARRMMERLHDWRRRQARECQRHRIVRSLVVDDVVLAAPLDRCRQVEHLVELPGPHVLVVPVAMGVDGVESRAGFRVGGRVQRDVVAARDEPFGEQRRHRLHRSGLGRRDGRGDRRDVGDSQAHAVSRSFGKTRDASKCSRAISTA